MNLLTMPDKAPLVRNADYVRMTVVFVGCPACGAYRGERCRGNSFRPWMGGVHSDRRVKSADRRRQRPEVWEKLKLQIWEQARKEKAQ